MQRRTTPLPCVAPAGEVGSGWSTPTTTAREDERPRGPVVGRVPGVPPWEKRESPRWSGEQREPAMRAIRHRKVRG